MELEFLPVSMLGNGGCHQVVHTLSYQVFIDLVELSSITTGILTDACDRLLILMGGFLLFFACFFSLKLLKVRLQLLLTQASAEKTCICALKMCLLQTYGLSLA